MRRRLPCCSLSPTKRLGSELYRLRGGFLTQRSFPTDLKEAHTYLHQALDIARKQHAKSLELCSAVSVARLWLNQGRSRKARDILYPTYEWFTEGFDTPDLKEAAVLLNGLS